MDLLQHQRLHMEEAVTLVIPDQYGPEDCRPAQGTQEEPPHLPQGYSAPVHVTSLRMLAYTPLIHMAGEWFDTAAQAVVAPVIVPRAQPHQYDLL